MNDIPPHDYIRTARTQALKMTQTELAEAIGVNLSTVWRWEKRIVPVPKWAVNSVSRLLETERAQ
jgi:DNA-binding XRE family transcriptional regulator